MNFMAVGFQNGSVVLFKGDVTKERYETTGQIMPTKGLCEFLKTFVHFIIHLIIHANKCNPTIHIIRCKCALTVYLPSFTSFVRDSKWGAVSK